MKPVICNYYLTYRCNAQCKFCSIWKDPKVSRAEEADAQTVNRNLDSIKRLGVRFVDFTGGEPLLYSALGRVLEHAKSVGLMTTVTSNGIAYPKHAHELKGLIDILQFSLHGPDMETHDAVSVTPSFDSVMESVDIAFSQGDTPTFIHTVTDENISRVNDVIDLARKKKALIFLNPEFSYFGNSGLSHKEAKSLIDMAKGPGVTVDRGFIEFYLAGGNRRYNPSCLAVTSTIVISPDDKLILPCYHRMTREEPIEGNLEELRRSPIVQFEEHQQGKYRFCEGCAVNCYMRASLYRKPGPFRWPSIQSALNYGWELSKAKLGTIIKGIVR